MDFFIIIGICVILFLELLIAIGYFFKEICSVLYTLCSKKSKNKGGNQVGVVEKIQFTTGHLDECDSSEEEEKVEEENKNESREISFKKKRNQRMSILYALRLYRLKNEKKKNSKEEPTDKRGKKIQELFSEMKRKPQKFEEK